MLLYFELTKSAVQDDNRRRSWHGVELKTEWTSVKYIVVLGRMWQHMERVDYAETAEVSMM